MTSSHPCCSPLGKYICVSLFLAVMLEAFEAKYEGGIGKDGTTFGSKMGSMISGLQSKMSSMGNSMRCGGAIM